MSPKHFGSSGTSYFIGIFFFPPTHTMKGLVLLMCFTLNAVVIHFSLWGFSSGSTLGKACTVFPQWLFDFLALQGINKTLIGGLHFLQPEEQRSGLPLTQIVRGKCGHQVFICVTVTYGDNCCWPSTASDSIQQVPKRGEPLSSVCRQFEAIRFVSKMFSRRLGYEMYFILTRYIKDQKIRSPS